MPLFTVRASTNIASFHNKINNEISTKVIDTRKEADRREFIKETLKNSIKLKIKLKKQFSVLSSKVKITDEEILSNLEKFISKRNKEKEIDKEAEIVN